MGKKDIAQHEPKERDAVTSRQRCARELAAFQENIQVPFQARRDAKSEVATQEVSAMTDAAPIVATSPAQAASPQDKESSPKAGGASPASKGVAPIEEETGAPVTAGGA